MQGKARRSQIKPLIAVWQHLAYGKAGRIKYKYSALANKSNIDIAIGVKAQGIMKISLVPAGSIAVMPPFLLAWFMPAPKRGAISWLQATPPGRNPQVWPLRTIHRSE